MQKLRSEKKQVEKQVEFVPTEAEWQIMRVR